MTCSPDDRFDTQDSAFQAARDSRVLSLGMHVPTRDEVATMPVTELYPIVIDWLGECPSELIPDDAQIMELQATLLMRPDAGDPDVQRLITACDSYLKT